MTLKNKILSWLIPSKWIHWLNGKKRILGAIQLGLWVLIYAIPRVKPEWTFIAAAGIQIQGFLMNLGLDMGNELLTGGVGFTAVGLIDWVLDHFPSKVVIGALKKIEAPIAKLSNGQEKIE